MSCKLGCMLHLIFCSRNCINMEMISDQRSQRGSEKITKNYLKVQHFLTYVSIAIIHWQLKVPPLSEFKRNEYEILFCKEMHLQPPCQCLVNTLKRLYVTVQHLMPEKKILDIERSSAGSNTGISSRYLTQGETQHLFTLPMTLALKSFKTLIFLCYQLKLGQKLQGWVPLFQWI